MGRLSCTNEEVDSLSGVKIKGFQNWHATMNCLEDNYPELRAIIVSGLHPKSDIIDLTLLD